MQWRYGIAHFILASVVALVLTLLMVCVDAQAQIAFVSDRTGNNEIYVMDINGKNQRRLTKNRGGDWSPSWSPDGKRIVFSSGQDGNNEIYVMDADGRNQVNLTNSFQGDFSPSWSPDGERIAFSSAGEIYVMDTDGGNQQRLTQDDHKGFSPSWSPDGQRIVFSSEREGHFRDDFGNVTSEIYVMDADGGNEQRDGNGEIYMMDE